MSEMQLTITLTALICASSLSLSLDMAERRINGVEKEKDAEERGERRGNVNDEGGGSAAK